MPAGMKIVLDRSTRRLSPDRLVGGSPRRVVRLSADGRAAYAELLAGPVASAAARSLARYLTDAGLAHPQPVAVDVSKRATVIVPARDRPDLLEHCLESLGAALPVVVVDDGSSDPDAIAKVAAEHGARLIRREVAGGPAAARNAAIPVVDTDFVVMVDSDCVVPREWVERLAGHLSDPVVGLVAPRIVPLSLRTSAQRFAATQGCLDLGDRPASVRPLTRVAYVPSTALVARRAALLEAARDGNVFDESLRYGEDVDLVWRMGAAGWRIRYEPSVKVQHEEPASWSSLLRRRFRYGTSAAALAQRHPQATQPLAVPVLPMAAVAAVVAGRPRLAALGAAATWIATRRVRADAGLSPDGTSLDTTRALIQTWIGAGRYAAQFLGPLALGGALRGGRRQRLTTAALLAAPGVAALVTSRPIDPPRLVVGSIADNVAYGAGVWAGCASEHTLRPVRPVVRGWRPTALPPQSTTSKDT